MESDIWLLWLQGMPWSYGCLTLLLAAWIEYVFPPFPGDTITILGAILMARADWPAWGVFLAIMLGSVGGAALNWSLGMWLARQDRHTFLHRWLAREGVASRVVRLQDKFARHGSMYILLNRFLPAFRSLFFIVAGMAHLPLGRVLFFAALSAALWNTALLGAGWMVGFHLEHLMALVQKWSMVVGVGLFLVVIVWFLQKLWRERSSGDRNQDADGL